MVRDHITACFVLV